ncbi:MAG: site-2 protease family protein [Ktedonobacteraceae bacterium]|nr:site-2 protease family protein [Ktedonobacteraceae bacterium]
MNAQERDYAHPEYYQSSGEQPLAQPAQPLDPYALHANSYSYTDYTIVPQRESGQEAQIDSRTNPYEAGREYRSPQDMQHYAPREETTQENVEDQESGGQGGGTRKRLTGIAALLAAIGGWLLKFKSLVFLLKFGTAGISALISIGFYAIVFGWPFAIGLVALLFVHEMGHALVMKLKGIPVGSMIFIPMLGAAVMMNQMPKNAKDEAEVGIAGPIAGALAASFCYFAAQTQPHSVWAPLAYFGFFMNLFNLIPIVPFDGGRVLAAIDRRIWIVGFVALLGYQIWLWMHGNFYPWLLIFVLMAAFQLFSRSRTADSPEARAYYDVPLMARITLGVLYFGLAAVLFIGMSMSHTLIPTVGRGF